MGAGGRKKESKVVPRFLVPMPVLSVMQKLASSPGSETGHFDLLKPQFVHL